jgi:hypothetical protein
VKGTESENKENWQIKNTLFFFFYFEVFFLPILHCNSLLFYFIFHHLKINFMEFDEKRIKLQNIFFLNKLEKKLKINKKERTL